MASYPSYPFLFVADFHFISKLSSIFHNGTSEQNVNVFFKKIDNFKVTNYIDSEHKPKLIQRGT